MTVKNVEKLEKSRVALEIEVGAEEFASAINAAFSKMRRRISIPGFRPGKAPRKMVEKLYGVEVFFSDAVDEALPGAYEKAIESEGLNVVGYPEVEIVDEVTQDGFTFKATVPVYPEVKLGEYKGVSAPKDEVVVTDDDVLERLNEMAERNARLVSVEREARLGDTCDIDFEGFHDGKPFDGGKGENFDLELGSGSFVPGFEDQLVGAKAGEEREVSLTFPEDYTPELAGKDVVFKVKINEVKSKELPELDDEFAKDVSEFDTLDELKADTRKKIEEERERSAQVGFENALLEKVAQNIECDIPDVMLEEQSKRFLEEFKARVAAQGIPYDQYAKMTGMDEEKFMEDSREPAERQVRLDLAIAKIIEEEKLEASDEDVEAEYKRLAEVYGMDVEKVKQYLREADIRAQVLNRKAVDVVVDNAKAEKAEKKAAKSAKKTAKKAEKAEEKAEKKENEGE